MNRFLSKRVWVEDGQLGIFLMSEHKFGIVIYESPVHECKIKELVGHRLIKVNDIYVNKMAACDVSRIINKTSDRTFIVSVKKVIPVANLVWI